MRAKDAWDRAAECAALAEEATDAKSRALFVRLRDSWIEVAHSCEIVEAARVPSTGDREGLKSGS